ncbi:MAG: hypothetical protein RI957_2268, partial [Verrucomicrobiota bacterium]
SQRGSRPFVAFLPKRIKPLAYDATKHTEALLGDDFILVPRPAAGSKAQQIRIEWRCK